MKKIGMLGVLTNLGTRLYSHNAGWTYVTRSILSEKCGQEVDIVSNSDDFDQYDVLIINEGANFKPGVFNFFGGAQDRQIDALKRFSSYKGQVLYLNNFADYTIPCKKRKDLLDYSDLTFPEGKVIDITKYGESVIVGDSHSISAWEPGSTINRLDGKTLNGALKIGLKNLIPSQAQKYVKFYFGNIDVRFHFNRFGGLSAIDKLLNEYERQLIELKNKGYFIKLTHLIPIENESRKIPGTGKYKGENFFGTQLDRTTYVNYFNQKIDEMSLKNDFKVSKWINLNYEELSFDDMESRQSVHLRPSSYMYANKFIKK
tara:strand:+ start:431 stop:1378 length:948 start_codon:yes stop_codon:yes gene_type:complete